MSDIEDPPPTNPNPVEPTDGGKQRQPEQQAVLSIDQLQTMISGSIQAALPALENVIATKVVQSLQVQGKRY